MKHSLHLLAISVLLVNGAIVARGALVSYHATGDFTTSSFPSDIAVGDQFTIDFTYDDSVSDTDPNQSGTFPGALVSLDFKLSQGHSTGQYAGGYLTTPGEVETIDGTGFNYPDRFYARVLAGTFPRLGGNPFQDLLFVLDDPSCTSSINDPGGYPTLASELNGALVLSQFSQTTVRIDAADKSGAAQGVVTSLTIVPEPSFIALIAVSGLTLIWRRCKLG